MNRHNFQILTLLPLGLALAGSLGGCGDFRQAFGLDKQSPDEYTVVEHAPLTIPPDFALRPPRNPSERSEQDAPAIQARETVFKASGQSQVARSDNGMSGGENALLAHAGAAGANSGVRAQIDQDAVAANNPHTGFVDSLLFWKGAPKPSDESLNSVEAAKAARDKAAAGQQAPDGSAAPDTAKN